METVKNKIKGKLLTEIQSVLSNTISELTFDDLRQMKMEDMHSAFVEVLKDCIEVANQAYESTKGVKINEAN